MTTRPAPAAAIDFLMRCLKGNEQAVAFVLDIVHVADVWDNLIDGDVVVAPKDIDSLCKTMMLSMTANRFFIEHASVLLPVMRASILNWKIANAMSHGGVEDRVQAHVLRYAPIDIIVMCAAIVGGDEWAEQIGPELRRFHMRDTLRNFLCEMEERDQRNR